MSNVRAQMPTLLTNVHVYRAIAEEAFSEASRLEVEARRPKPDGAPGYVISLDPSRSAFKQSLIAIAFSGVYLEALLFLRGTQRLGDQWLQEFDRKTYEEKLKHLGVTDESLIQSAKRLRMVRRELVHEKAAANGNLAPGKNYWAQVEAAEAIALIRNISSLLEDAP